MKLSAGRHTRRAFFLLMLVMAAIGMIAAQDSSAATVEELEAQIAALLEQVTALQQQLASLQGSFASGETVTFVRNLAVGDRGADVRRLQIILNKDAKTQVALTGPGSPGHETDFFGSLTRDAVVRFQELYREDVLAPHGLVRGTGFVGPTTRAKLNELARGGTVSETSIPDIEFGEEDDYDFFIGISEPDVPSALVSIVNEGSEEGERVNRLEEIMTGFQAGMLTLDQVKAQFEALRTDESFDRTGNIIHFGDRTITAASDGKYLYFNIPNVEPGTYDVWVENSQGRSARIEYTVLGATHVPHMPVIHDITPRSGSEGTTVTITGSGFSPTNNILNIGFGEIPNVPAVNGTEITFKISSSVPGKIRDRLLPMTVPVYVTANGVKSHGGQFMLTK